MKANELMLWDWVYVPHRGKASHYGKVTALLSSGAVETEINGSLALSSSVEPIPLTTEILEKNGFSAEGYNMGVVGFHTDPIPDVKDGYEVFIWKDMCLEIKHGFTHLKRYTFYVHELQHALRLCGIEKEIVL